MFELQWQVIESHRFEPAADLTGAMAAAIERLGLEGWQISIPVKWPLCNVRPCYSCGDLLSISRNLPMMRVGPAFSPDGITQTVY